VPIKPRAADPSDEWQAMPAYESRNLQAAYHVTVSFKSDEDAATFFRLIDRPKKKRMWWPASDGHKGSDTKLAYVAVAVEGSDAAAA